MKKYLRQKICLSAAIAAAEICLFAPNGFAADLSLKDAVEAALKNSTPLRITAQGEKSAEIALRRAKGSNGVSVTASDNFSVNKSKSEKRRDSNSIGVTGSLPIYTGGKNQANIKSAKIGIDTAELTTEREREKLRYDVIKAYYDALEARKTIAVNRESADNYAAHYENVSALYAAGSKAKIDVLRSSVELSDARQTLIKSQNTYEVNLATLRNLINMDRDEPLNLTDDFSYEPFADSMENCIDYAFNNRKDLIVDAYTVRQKELSVDMAKAGYKPSVNLSVGLNQSNEFHPTSSDSHSVTAGVGVSWNVFDSGVTKAAVDAAETERDTALLTLKRDRENVDLSVRTAYYNMKEAQKRFGSTSDAVQEAEEDYFIAREKYRAGEGIMLDIIDAQLALSRAKLNYISAQYDYARYKAQLAKEMGIALTGEENAAAAELKTAVDDVSIEPLPAMSQNKATTVSREAENVIDETAGGKS